MKIWSKKEYIEEFLDDDEEEYANSPHALYGDNGDPKNYEFDPPTIENGLVTVVIRLKKYNNSGYMADWHLAWEHDDFSQDMEGVYSYEPSNKIEDAVTALLSLGMECTEDIPGQTTGKKGKITTADCKKAIVKYIRENQDKFEGVFDDEPNYMNDLLNEKLWTRERKLSADKYREEMCEESLENLFHTLLVSGEGLRDTGQTIDKKSPVRLFYHKNFEDTFRVEVVSNVDDTAIAILSIGID